MSRWLKAVPLTLALAAVSIFAGSCGNGNQAQIRFVHAMQDGAPMDVDVNGALVFTDVSFLGVQPTQPGYTGVPSGNDSIEGFLTGTTTVGFNKTNLSWSAATQYTVVATGFVANNQNATILSIPDNNAAPPDGFVEFRVIHASPSGPGNVDIYIELNPSTGPLLPVTFSGLAYTQASSYFRIAFNPNNDPTPPGYTVYVTTAGSQNPIFSENVSPANAGAIRTLVLTDVQDGTTMNNSFLELSDLN